ncbi:MAG: Cna B-type domain-containing protein [Lachnospiraceae bacterium]|nr:Cna B-type domain-containing protein [Lachnospiraceae bacterium]
MTKKLKKFFAMLLTFSMMMNLLGTTAFADEETNEHEHTDDCYETILICEEEQDLICDIPSHTHSDDCKHSHTDACYEVSCGFDTSTPNCGKDGTLECTITGCIKNHECGAEIIIASDSDPIEDACEYHEHTDSCYHSHTDSCYHSHSDGCGTLSCDIDTESVQCGLEEHEHDDTCYADHEHDEDCYEEVLVCDGEDDEESGKKVMLLTATPGNATPSDAEYREPTEPGDFASKSSELIDRSENRYKIEIKVPGEDGKNLHDEVILMVDGSYSMDNEWPAMKEAINTIGRTVLNGSGTTQLTLMAFGMGDNIVLEHVKDANELASALGALPGNLLYGRSSTNCEAGFTGVAEYIENHDETLNDVHVIFISDGNVNTDETPRAFDTNWKTFATKFGPLTVIQEAFCGTVAAGVYPEAFVEVFGNRFDGKESEEIIESASDGTITEDEFMVFADLLWEEVYEYSGLTPGEEYPVSDVERAFVKYDKEKGTYIQDAFYYTTYKSNYVTYGDRWTRTPAAADALAEMEEVTSMYVVDYDGYTAWMDTGITSEKSTFVKSNGIAGLCEALQGALKDLSKTPYNDVVVTDYMSKWVNLEKGTFAIKDNVSGKDIWTSKDGWKTTDRPTDREIPIKLEKVAPNEYPDGGPDVIENTSGDIYRVTWYVKDGAMLRADNYTLSYEVTVDTEEDGFEYDEEYPANGNTDIYYNDEDGEKENEGIEVPFVNTTSLYVKKVWAGDANPDKPDSVTVQLLQNDEFYNKIELSAENNWSFRWTELDIEKDWTIVEVDVPEGYTATYKNDGNSWTITNTYKAPENNNQNNNPNGGGGHYRDDDDDRDGGSSTTIIIQEQEVPLAAADTIEIAENDVPLSDGVLNIEDEQVPLAVLPMTGDVSVIWMLISLISGLGLAGVSFADRKKRR